jgi:hypothetical protein
VEEKKDLSGIGISFGQSKQVKIVVSYVEVLEYRLVSNVGASILVAVGTKRRRIH